MAVAITVVICVSVAMVVAVSVPMSVAVAVAMTVTMLMAVSVSLTLRAKTDKKSAEEDASSVLYGVLPLSAVRRRRIFRPRMIHLHFRKAIINFCALMIVHSIFKFSIVFKRYQ